MEAIIQSIITLITGVVFCVIGYTFGRGGRLLPARGKTITVDKIPVGGGKVVQKTEKIKDVLNESLSISEQSQNYSVDPNFINIKNFQ